MVINSSEVYFSIFFIILSGRFHSTESQESLKCFRRFKQTFATELM